MDPYANPDQPSAAPWPDLPGPPATDVRGGRGVRLAGMVLATVWLVLSIGAGIWLIVASPGGTTNVTVRGAHLSATSEETSYGGDAYTGIQNAASDTEHAVVDGVNGMARMQVALAKSSAQQRHDIASHLATGLGVLVIGVGITNFTLALQRISSRS